MNFYVSFGQQQTHTIDDIFLDKDVLVVIEAEDEAEARDRAFKAFKMEWSFMYTDETVELEWFPRGTITVPSI